MTTETDVQPWTAEEADKHSRMALFYFAGDDCHNKKRCHQNVLARTNCGLCALLGYEPNGGWGDDWSVKRDGPNYAGWARMYVEAGVSIPEKWRAAFELQRQSDNKAYASALERSIATFGVTFV